MKFLIPSYRRPDSLHTVDTLRRFGVDSSGIYVGVQTPEDFDAYRKKVGSKANVVYKSASNCAGNRNNLLSLLKDGEYACMMDDDVLDLLKYDPKLGKYGEFVPISADEFKLFVSQSTEIMARHQVNLAGPQTGTNALFIANKKKRYAKNKVVNGGFMIVKACSTTRFDETFDCLDDVEATLREFAEGRGTIVFQNYSVKKKGDQTGRGGCQEVYRNGGQEKALQRLEGMYRPIAKRSKDGTSMVIVRGVL